MSTPDSWPLRDMTEADLAVVLAIEQAVHSHPWTEGNFRDALQAGNLCRVMQTNDGVAGYAVVMRALDEAELLDIAIDAAQQRRGWGARLLQALMEELKQQGMVRIFLEVRASNVAAIGLYERCGYAKVGLRRGYYPAATTGREDAILMGREL